MTEDQKHFNIRRARGMLLVASLTAVLMMIAVTLYALSHIPAWVVVVTFVGFVAAILRAIWYGLHGLT